MHLLITGGTGFIGQALCPALLQAGHQVSVLTRDPQRATRSLPGITAVRTLTESRPMRSSTWPASR